MITLTRLEAAELIGVSVRSFNRQVHNRKMPEAIERVSNIPCWDQAEIIAAIQRQGKETKSAMLLRSKDKIEKMRETMTKAEIAKSFGVDPSTLNNVINPCKARQGIKTNHDNLWNFAIFGKTA